ncbi:type I restriction-modification system subunit M [Nostoc sp.]|uniref:type I restriction-modification system subunit M n=1 Tax=Nostoc sp. TaxID=1180 RepID=UPI002FF562C8
MSRTEKVRKLAGFIWSIAELLRGDYKQADYGKVILPFTVLRRLDCVLEPTKALVMEFYETKLKSMNLKNPEPLLNQKAGVTFHNISQFTFQKLKADPDNVAANLRNFINGFSIAGREIIEYFNFTDQINRLDEANLLFLIVKNFAEINLHPDEVNSMEMGYVFEELIRKFSELSNETAGEHFTPREVIRLMVNLLFLNERNILTQEGIVTTIYDPACGTGGMLSLAEEYIKELNQNSKPVVFGQEINPESYAICKSDMLIKGQNIISELSRPDYDNARSEAQFIFGGWRWQTSEFSVWRLFYDLKQEVFTAQRYFLDDSQPVCFIGDLESDDLILELYEEVGMKDIKLDMQPLKLLINKIRDTSLPSSSIRGAPQIGKVYRSGNCKVFGILWQSSNGKPHYQGRPIVGIQNLVHQYFDPDTCELINNLPDKKPDIVKFLHNDEISFVNLCYNEVDNLKVDLNEFQRGKLHEILRQVAYEQFLIAVKIIEQTEAQP